MSPPPPAWLDWVAVDRAIHHKPVGRPLSHAEQVAVTRHIAEHGGGTSQIVRTLHVRPQLAAALLREATPVQEAPSMDQLAPEIRAVVPNAHDLVTAVHNMDPKRVADVLANTDLAALCVVLAAGHTANVDLVDAIRWATDPDEYLHLRDEGVQPGTAAVLAGRTDTADAA